MTGEPLHKDSTQPRPARFGGQVARRWRRSVARLATSASDERTFTLKFPLDTLGRAVAFEPAAAQYNVVEGIREGSLFAFVSGLHLAGFRLFTSVAEASTFRQKSGFDSAAFGAMAEAHLGIAAPGFTGEAQVLRSPDDVMTHVSMRSIRLHAKILRLVSMPRSTG